MAERRLAPKLGRVAGDPGRGVLSSRIGRIVCCDEGTIRDGSSWGNDCELLEAAEDTALKGSSLEQKVRTRLVGRKVRLTRNTTPRRSDS